MNQENLFLIEYGIGNVINHININIHQQGNPLPLLPSQHHPTTTTFQPPGPSLLLPPRSSLRFVLFIPSACVPFLSKDHPPRGGPTPPQQTLFCFFVSKVLVINDSDRSKQQPGYIGSYCMDALSMSLHCIYVSNSRFPHPPLKPGWIPIQSPALTILTLVGFILDFP